jgi:hypothetical protein
LAGGTVEPGGTGPNRFDTCDFLKAGKWVQVTLGRAGYSLARFAGATKLIGLGISSDSEPVVPPGLIVGAAFVDARLWVSSVQVARSDDA